MILWRLLSALLLLAAGCPVSAAVTITFYSHDFGSSFPHAFIVLEGTPDAGGAPISGNYGFTARHISPAILTGSVNGDIESASAAYVANSDPHWRMTLSDGQYATVLAVMAQWNALPGKSYNLHRRNCVHFVADVARTLGLDVVEPKALMQKPRSFLHSVLARNITLQVPAADRAEIVSASAPAGQIPMLRASIAPAIDPAAPPPPPFVAAPMAESGRSLTRSSTDKAVAPSTTP